MTDTQTSFWTPGAHRRGDSGPSLLIVALAYLVSLPQKPVPAGRPPGAEIRRRCGSRRTGWSTKYDQEVDVYHRCSWWCSTATGRLSGSTVTGVWLPRRAVEGTFTVIGIVRPAESAPLIRRGHIGHARSVTF